MPIATLARPFNGETLRVFEPLTPEQLNDKLDLSAAAFSLSDDAVPGCALSARIALQCIDAMSESFRPVDHDRDGKPLISSVHEIEKCARVCRYYAHHAEHYLADEMIETNATKRVLSAICRWRWCSAIVLPWNYPFLAGDSLPCLPLMARNTGLLQALRMCRSARSRSGTHLSRSWI